MEHKTLISIITPVFNGEDFIAITLDSVLNSKIPFSYEYLVINDGSTDNTSKILSKYSDNLKVFTQVNKGESAAVNFGIDNANGKYILVLNADDPLFSVDIFSESIDFLESHQDVVATYPDWIVIDSDGNRRKIIRTKEFSEKLLVGLCKVLPGPGAIFRRHDALAIGKRNINFRYVGDYDFWLRLSRRGRIVRIPKVLAQWRSHDRSTSISHRSKAMAEERMQVIENFLNDFKVSAKISRMALGNSCYMAARLCFFDSTIAGRNLFIMAIKKRRGFPEEAKILESIFLLGYPWTSQLVNYLPHLKNLYVSKIRR